jgi:ABC-type amino acid transport substrate-binding protein
MKKKILSIFLSVALVAAMLAGCGGSSSAPAESDATEKSTEAAASTESSGEKIRFGALSVLNISEDEFRDMNLARRNATRIITNGDVPEGNAQPEVIYYDNLDAMQMALEAGDIDRMDLPKSTADYLVANNDKLEVRDRSDEYEKLTEEEKGFLDRLSSNGFAFMMREDSEKLRDDFDDALDDMEEDGTLDKLVKEYITDVIDGKEPKAVEFEDKGDETIKVAVTGDLPPMDYVAADGSFAGFNTAILAEIGKRLNKKIELKQVDSAARAISLSSKEADVVFWTRVGTGKPDEDEIEEFEKRQKQNISGEDEEKREEVIEALSEGGSRRQKDMMDMPEGTMVTDPYYVDRLVIVSLKN